MLKLLDTLISDTEQLLDLVKQDDLKTFLQLEQQRQANLDQLDLLNINISDSQRLTLVQRMQTLIELNAQLEQECRNWRDHAATELKKFNQGNKAKKAYSG